MCASLSPRYTREPSRITIMPPSPVSPGASLIRLISFRPGASSTTSDPVPPSRTSASLPSGVSFRRFASVMPRLSVWMTFLLATSMMETPPSPRVAVHSSRPSGERSIPSGVLPGTGIAVTCHFGGPAEIASMTDTLFDPRLGTNIVLPSRLSTIMCVPFWPMPSIQSILFADGS